MPTCDAARYSATWNDAALSSTRGNGDGSTFDFLRWYVAEQNEEEHLFESILDKIELIGVEGHGLFLIDKEIGNLAQGRSGS